MLNKIDMYFFSPTGGTRRVAEAFCAGLAGEIVAHDMCRRNVELAQPTGDAAVIAVPVYGGRIPRCRSAAGQAQRQRPARYNHSRVRQPRLRGRAAGDKRYSCGTGL